MNAPVGNGSFSWIAPNRKWRGQRALVPLETCHRILQIFLWTVSVIGIFALTMAYARGPELLKANPLFWLLCSLQVPTALAAIFRGWPFEVRFATLAVSLFAFATCTSMELGITPNWAFEITILVASTSLFFGARAGGILVIGITVTHLLVAWGWVAGWLPAFMPISSAATPYMDFKSGAVWVRVLIVAAVSQGALIALMRHVLSDLNNALRNANSSLQKLAVEQEYRARAEEARMKAELAVREAQKFDALGRLAGGVAHDFNNALCVIKCWSSFLTEERRDPAVMEAMADIRRATENAEQLTHHLLAFSRTDPGPKEVVDFSEVARLEGKTLARLLPRNIAVSVEATAPVYVRVGGGQLQEVILNLAINSRDAMPAGGRLELRVSPIRQEDSANGLASGDYVRFEISDTGHGMDPTTQARIFEPFFTTKAPGKGTGLGLAMVFGVVTGAGGAIHVESRIGKGTRFTIHLPAARPGEQMLKPKMAAITAPVRCRVLIVEHQPEIRLLLERIVSREGFPVIAVADGDEAWAALAVEGGSFGLLLTTGVMPGRSTGEIIARALEVDPNCRVVVVSDQLRDDGLTRDVESGRYRLLSKPFDAGQLREAVNDVLRQSR